MVVEQHNVALQALKHCNYYRLSGYWKPFEVQNSVPSNFEPCTKFDQVLELYYFDKRLRLLVLDAIECIEISVRSSWAYYMAEAYGSHAHLDIILAKNQSYYSDNKKILDTQLKQAKDEPVIKHFNNNYLQSTPPIWAICEVMSFGLLSKYYDNLKPKKTRRKIANVYGLDDGCFASWLQNLNEVRNVCAHHSRLWNRKFVKTPQNITGKPSVLAGQFTSTRTIYNTLMILLYLIDRIDPKNNWRTQLLNLLNQHPALLPKMGFPPSWATQTIWSEANV